MYYKREPEKITENQMKASAVFCNSVAAFVKTLSSALQIPHFHKCDYGSTMNKPPLDTTKSGMLQISDHN
jgi:hypothetical protein